VLIIGEYGRLLNTGAIESFLARLAVVAMAFVPAAEGSAGVELRGIVQEVRDAMREPGYGQIQAS
jgi:hypothetical protein